MRHHIASACVAAGLVFGASAVSAASLGLTKEAPSFSASLGFVDFLDFAPEGDLSTFGPEVDFTDGVSPNGLTVIGLGIVYSLADPKTGLSGGFDVEDEDGLFLGGDLFAVGFGDDLIELQFNNLSGSGAGSFGSSVLMEIAFDDLFDELGANPFSDFVDGTSYDASITISNVANVAPIPLPAGLPLLLTGLGGVFLLRRHKAVS